MARNITACWKCSAFYDHALWQAAWNYGIVECWNTGYKKRKKSSLLQMSCQNYRVIAVTYSFSAFDPEISLLYKHKVNTIKFDLILKFHYSIIPERNIPTFRFILGGDKPRPYPKDGFLFFNRQLTTNQPSCEIHAPDSKAYLCPSGAFHRD